MTVTGDELLSTDSAMTKPWPASPETYPFVEPVPVVGIPIVRTRSYIVLFQLLQLQTQVPMC